MVGVLHICMFTLMLFTVRKLCVHLATSVYMTLCIVLACWQCILIFPFAFVLRSYISVYTMMLSLLYNAYLGLATRERVCVCVYTIAYFVVLLFDVEISVFVY